MSTQIVHLDLGDIPAAITVRDDVSAVLLVLFDEGRPVELRRVTRPADGVISLREIGGPHPANRPHATPSAPRALRPVSVVVPTHERPDDLARCIESMAGIRAAGHEVIVVDSGPVTSRTASIVERFGVRYVCEPLPGTNRARNAGTRAATRDIVAFVDDDVVVSPTWLETISACFDDSSVGCVTGLVLPLELETDGQEEFELYSGHRRHLRRCVYSRDVLRASAAGIVGIGANMAFRRKLLLALKGFDVRLGPGTRTRTGDETDMFARVLDSGQLIVYTPDAYVWHRHRRSAREVRSCVFGYGVGLYSMLTKRLLEQHDLGAVITAGRWLVGPVLKAARAKIAGRPAPQWKVVLSETAGAPLGPFCFGYESWRSRGRAGIAAARSLQ